MRGFRAIGHSLALAALFGGLAPAAGDPLPHPDCAPGSARSETFDSLGPRGEIRLASGDRVLLDSLRWPAEDGEARAALAAWAGRRLLIVPRGQPDRWGRSRADALGEDGETDLAGALVGAGLALADANEAEALCRPALRLLEATARAQHLGLWRDPLPRAEDAAALRAVAWRYAVVEGRIRHIGERRARTYLDFGPRGSDGLTVTVTKRTWRTMAAHGLTADSLRGRRVRVRGFVELGRGPTLSIATADAIEVLDETPAVPHEAPGPDDSGIRR